MIQMRLSGSGGQGLILLGIILAEAALIDGKLAIQSQSYGPEARGGASKSEVIISESPIHYPKVIQPDLVLALTQEATKKYSSDLSPQGVLLVDTDYVQTIPENITTVYRLPIIQACKQELGKTLFANIVALGAIVTLTESVTWDSAVQAVLSRVPKGTEEINKKAMDVGRKLIEEAQQAKQ